MTALPAPRQCLQNTQSSWVVPGLLRRTALSLFMIFVLTFLAVNTWTQSYAMPYRPLAPLVAAVLATAASYYYVHVRHQGRNKRWAPDRVTIDLDHVLGHYDSRPGPGGAATALLPFRAVTEIRRWPPIMSVNTVWGKLPVSAAWNNPPSEVAPTGARMPVCAVMNLTMENGQKVYSAWSSYLAQNNLLQGVALPRQSPEG